MTAWNSSYLFGYDNETGWGYRYYYTFYNETGPRDILSIVLEFMLHMLIFILSLFVNIVVLVTLSKFSEIRTVTNSFLFNVAAADIVFALSMPTVMISRISNQWVLEEIACKAFPYQQSVSAVVLLWSLCLISVERYMSTISPPDRKKLTVRQAHMLSALVWFILAILFLPIALFFRTELAVDIVEFQNMFELEGDVKIMKNSSIYLEPEDILPEYYSIMGQSKEVRKICTLVFPKSDIVDYAQLCLFAIMFICLTPVCLLIFNYQAIFRKLMKSKDIWGSSCVSVSTASVPGRPGITVGTGRRQSEISISDVLAPWPRKQSNPSHIVTGRQGSLSKHEEIRAGKHIKTVRILFINVIVVLSMWLPILVVLVLLYFDGKRPSIDQGFYMRAHHFTAALMVCHLNTIVTPLLFCLFSEDFLNSIKRLFHNTIFDMNRSGRKQNGTMHNGHTIVCCSDLEVGMELNAATIAMNRRRMERNDVLRDKVAPATNGIRSARNGSGISANRVTIDIHPSRIHSSISE